MKKKFSMGLAFFMLLSCLATTTAFASVDEPSAGHTVATIDSGSIILDEEGSEIDDLLDAAIVATIHVYYNWATPIFAHPTTGELSYFTDWGISQYYTNFNASNYITMYADEKVNFFTQWDDLCVANLGTTVEPLGWWITTQYRIQDCTGAYGYTWTKADGSKATGAFSNGLLTANSYRLSMDNTSVTQSMQFIYTQTGNGSTRLTKYCEGGIRFSAVDKPE